MRHLPGTQGAFYESWDRLEEADRARLYKYLQDDVKMWLDQREETGVTPMNYDEMVEAYRSAMAECNVAPTDQPELVMAAADRATDIERRMRETFDIGDPEMYEINQSIATPGQLAHLKADWLGDGSWDIYEQGGVFEPYRDHLKAFQEEVEAEAERRLAAEERTFAVGIGLEDNPALAQHIKRMGERIFDLEEEVTLLRSGS